VAVIKMIDTKALPLHSDWNTVERLARENGILQDAG
jgi:hypothetical protein